MMIDEYNCGIHQIHEIYYERYMIDIKDSGKRREQDDKRKYLVQYHILHTSIMDDIHISGIKIMIKFLHTQKVLL